MCTPNVTQAILDSDNQTKSLIINRNENDFKSKLNILPILLLRYII